MSEMEQAAVATLESLGYTYSVGSSMGGVWEPPPVRCVPTWWDDAVKAGIVMLAEEVREGGSTDE